MKSASKRAPKGRSRTDAMAGVVALQRGESPRAAIGLLILICAVGWLIRVLPPSASVFSHGEVVFPETDPWYHVRLVENLVHHFPHLNLVDPYGHCPDGLALPVAPLFDWLLGATSLIVGLGSPSQRTIELVCAFAPPTMALGAILAVFFLGTMMQGHRTGLIAATLLAFMPSSFLSFSVVGYTDHHVLETLCSTLVMLAVCKATSLPTGESEPARPVNSIPAWSWCAGMLLAAYCLAWVGAVLWIGLLAVWLVMQMCLDRVRGKPIGPLLPFGVALFVPALIAVAAAGACGYPLRDHLTALLAALTSCILIIAIAACLHRKRWGGRFFPLTIIILLSITATILALIAPERARSLFALLQSLPVHGGAQTLVETMPLLWGPDGFTLERAYGQFTTSFFLALFFLPMLAYRAVTSPDRRWPLLFLWSLCMLVITLARNRFAYYFAVNVAILSAMLAEHVLHWLKSRFSPLDKAGNHIVRIMGSFLIAALWLAPNFPPTWQAVTLVGVPSSDWREALNWMRQHTPEPFGDPAYYFARYADTGAIPSSMPTDPYGVMTWWDAGYWVTRMARRVPTANPTQQSAREVAQFFLSQDEHDAAMWMDRLRARYVILDDDLGFMPIPGGQVAGKFAAVVAWAGEPLTKYVEVFEYDDPQEGRSRLTLFHSAWYRTFLARLYVFRGRAVTPAQVVAAKLRSPPAQSTTGFREIVELRTFGSNEQAQEFVAAATEWEVLGNSPFTSCVPLEPLREYRLIHQSPTIVAHQGSDPIAAVEVYERTAPSH